MLSKKTVYDKLVTKVNAIETKIPSTSELVTKTQYGADKHGFEKKIRMLTKIFPMLLDWSTRLNTAQKSQRLKAHT